MTLCGRCGNGDRMAFEVDFYLITGIPRDKIIIPKGNGKVSLFLIFVRCH